MKVICLVLFSIVSYATFSQSISTNDFRYYCQVADKYEINPPELEYGYPWWFDADSLPVSGIIFLKEDLAAPLEKLSDTSWVARPTAENAKEIVNFSKFGSMFNIFIIPDSSLSYGEVRNFIENLMLDDVSMEVKFFTQKGSYFPMSYIRQIYDPNVIICGLGFDWLEIKCNSKFNFLVDRKLEDIEAINEQVFDHFVTGWKAKSYYSKWRFREFSREKLLEYIKMDSFLLGRGDSVGFKVFNLIHKQQLRWFDNYGSLKIPDNFDKIRVRIQSKSISIGKTYKIYNEIQKGTFIARKELFSNWEYVQLYALRQFDKLHYIHAQIPDWIFDYEREIDINDLILEVPIPPQGIDVEETPLPEDSEIYKALMLESKDEPIDVDSLN